MNILKSPPIKAIRAKPELKWLKKLEFLYQHGKADRLIDDLIVHGSYGDFTFNTYSDLELTILWANDLSRHSIEFSPQQKTYIRKINQLLIDVDPLQHHGPFHLDQKSFIDYPLKELPLAAYSQSWSIGGVNKEVNLVWDEGQFSLIGKERLFHTINNLKAHKRHFFRYGYNLYSQKRFLSNLFMLPVFYYNSEGLALSKLEAISDVNSMLPQSIKDLVHIASCIRCCWPRQPIWSKCLRQYFIAETIPGGLPDMLLVNLFQNPGISRMIKRLVLHNAWKDL